MGLTNEVLKAFAESVAPVVAYDIAPSFASNRLNEVGHIVTENIKTKWVDRDQRWQVEDCAWERFNNICRSAGVNQNIYLFQCFADAFDNLMEEMVAEEA